MRLESKAATTDRNWWILRAVVFLAFALYFVYDGAIGWPGAIRKDAEKQLAGGVFDGQVRYDDLPLKPEKTDFQAFVRKLEELRRENQPLRAELLAPRDEPPPLGSPVVVKPVGGREERYYAGKYGWIAVEIDNDRIVPDTMKWNDWKKDYDRDKVVGQFYWSLLPGVFGLYFLYRAIRAATLRVVIDDEGMIYGGRRISFSAMTSLRDFSPKGWVDLYFQHNGRSEKLRLDNEKVLRFNEIVDELVREKGFEHPIQAYERKRAAEAAEATADEAESAEEAPQDTATPTEPGTSPEPDSSQEPRR